MLALVGGMAGVAARLLGDAILRHARRRQHSAAGCDRARRPRPRVRAGCSPPSPRCSPDSSPRCRRRARQIVDHLREGAREGSGGASRRTRNVLVAAEVAMSLILLTGAGLLIRTLWTMQQAPRGFSAGTRGDDDGQPAGGHVREAAGRDRLLRAPARARARAAGRGVRGVGHGGAAAARRQLRHLQHRRPAAAAAGRTDRVPGRNRLTRILRDDRHDHRARPRVSPMRTTPTCRASW